MAQPSLSTRLAARLVAVAGGAVGTVVLAGMVLVDAAHRRPARPARNT